MSSRVAAADRSRAVPFLVLALLGLAALTGPVRAAEGDPGPPGVDLEISETEAIDAMIELVENAEPWPLGPDVHFAVLDDLLLEIALLDHVDAFPDSAPTFIADIHDAYAPWPDAPRDTTLDFLFDVDDRLADTKNEVNQQIGPAPVLAFALDELPIGVRARLDSGDTGFVDVVPYARALNEVMSSGNSEFLASIGAHNAPLVADLPFELANPELAGDLDELRAETAALRADVEELQRDTTEGETEASEPDGTVTRLATPPTASEPDPTAASRWPIAAALGVVVLVVGSVWSRRRRARAAADDGPAMNEIFEAHRRLASALDEAQIGEIGAATARSITGASDAFIFRQTTDGLRRIGDAAVVVSSALNRVVQTAQPMVAVLDNDPAVGSAAVCAVPLVNDGRVGAVMVVRRPSERPFDNEDRRRLELLAPALGGALASADTLGSYEHMALVDGLTSLGNRRRLDGDLETTLAEALAADLPVAFAMIDVDHFKHFNDTHGHEAGDRALQTVARVITETVRSTDVVYRYGGEEFSVLLPGATLDEATAAAERMRAAVEAARVEGEETQPGGRLTISVGISTLEAGDAGGLKTRADEALYEAKAQGRNRAVVA